MKTLKILLLSAIASPLLVANFEYDPSVSTPSSENQDGSSTDSPKAEGYENWRYEDGKHDGEAQISTPTPAP